ncbi:MAG: DUF1287 domain-containing protein [Desulfotomaculaceae bacterium]|nr:DUF1287 domain-containing protein [Desulfotomaculaceae bacterium]
MDRDIREHPGDYPRVKGAPEPNIDFRRVPNQEAFFKKYAERLTTEITVGCGKFKAVAGRRHRGVRPAFRPRGRGIGQEANRRCSFADP